MRAFSSVVISVLLLCFYTTNCLLPEECKPGGETICLVKCCENWQILETEKKRLKCANKTETNQTTIPNQIRYPVYASNEIKIDNESYLANITLFKPDTYIRKQGVSFEKEYVIGIIQHNLSAVLLVENYPPKIIPFNQYCVDNYIEGQSVRVLFRVDVDFFNDESSEAPNKAAALYFPFLLMSAICFFISALFYIFVLNLDNRNNKKCFVGYTISMGLAFTSLIFIQRVNSGCTILGVFFLFCTISGFVWFTFLCLDLVFDVIYFEDSEKGYHTHSLWVSYLVASILIPFVVVVASTARNGTPDLPDTFIKRYDEAAEAKGCSFKDSNIATFFAPISTALLFSLICICTSFYYISRNGKKYRTSFPWLDKKSKYRYRSISCGLIWIILTVWMIEVAVNVIFHKVLSSVQIDLIEALQGIFSLLIFVSDRYTRKDLRKIWRKKTRPEQSIETELTTQFGSGTIRNERTSLVNNAQTQD